MCIPNLIQKKHLFKFFIRKQFGFDLGFFDEKFHCETLSQSPKAPKASDLKHFSQRD